jgi:hypothetical protein
MRGQVLEVSTKVESLLGQLGASGRGIHERLSSVEDQISQQMVKKIRWIASVRNAAAHELEFHVDLDGFLRGGEEVINYLQALIAKAREDQKYSDPPPKTKAPEKKWSDMTGWEKAATVGTYAAAGAATLALLFISSK